MGFEWPFATPNTINLNLLGLYTMEMSKNI